MSDALLGKFLSDFTTLWKVRKLLKKMAVSLILSLFICLFNISFAAAEKQEWVDKTYDFTKVKRVVILYPNIADYLKNGIAENEIMEIFNKKAKISNVKAMDISQVVRLLKIDTGIDLEEVAKQNPDEALNLLHENMPNYADIVVITNVSDYSMGSTYRQGFSYNTTSTQTSYIYGSNGQSAAINTPVTETHKVRGGNVSVAQAHVRFDVYDTKISKTIFSRMDNRDVANPTILHNTKPKSVFKRIVGGFFDNLNDRINKKK